MIDEAKDDVWKAGDSYDVFMGRWSQKIAPRFLDWCNADKDLDWLDVGCGTGALSSTILSQCTPRSLTGVEQSVGFISTAQQNVSDGRATFKVGDAQALPMRDDSVDVVVSALVLNFIPDIPKALSEMKRVARPGGTVAFYVWDYPGGGLEFAHRFWEAAIALDPNASNFATDKLFPFCTPAGLTELATNAGLQSVESLGIAVPTVFKDFEDYWRPFALGTGPAPGYCVSLANDARQLLKEKLNDELPCNDDGSISLSAQVWAIKALTI